MQGRCTSGRSGSSGWYVQHSGAYLTQTQQNGVHGVGHRLLYRYHYRGLIIVMPIAARRCSSQPHSCARQAAQCCGQWTPAAE